MELRGRFSAGSRPLPVIAIPRARQPLLARPIVVLPPLESSAEPARSGHLRGLIRVAEAAIVLIALYVLIGAGIGAAAGSLMAGGVAGFIAGVCAIAAILLIRGSAVSAG